MLTSLTSPNLVLAPNSLSDGIIYRFKLQITTPSEVVFALQNVSSSPLPSQGVFIVNPSSGSALTTRFALQCNGWESFDGSSLRYSFSYLN